MRRRGELPELLAPAGDFDCLVSAVEGGADAVYVGGRRFGARAFAKNFDIDELSRAVRYCHLHGVRLYVTVNTLVEDREIEDVVAYARELWRIGVDAVIISDIGVIREIRRSVPALELHASTQMSVHNSLGAEEAYRLGCVRVVLARELSLENIKSTVENSSAEIEVFVHGALCVCHSGQCLFSSLVGGRSGNRGECAQPCRLPYKTPKGTGYPLSLKDLSLAEHIPALIDSGVASLKIEGRMKSAGYVYTVTSIYRRLLDERRSATAAEYEELRRAFSRDGFTDGYFIGRLASGMTGVRSESDKADSKDIEKIRFEPKRKEVRARVKIALGVPSQMTLTDGVRSVTAFGECAARAESAPLTYPSVCDRLSKMGNTYLSLPKENIELTLDEGVNLSPSDINALRRSAAEKFESCEREAVELEYKYSFGRRKSERVTSAQFMSESEYLSARAIGCEQLQKIDYSFVPLYSSSEAMRLALGVALPPVILDSELLDIRKYLEKAKSAGVLYALVGNIGQISLVKEYGFKLFGDFRINISNSAARDALADMGVRCAILSPELTLPKVRDISGGIVSYGRIPLMITERCFIKDSFGCDRCTDASLVDRLGERFPMMREYGHRTLILNSSVTYMGDRQGELDAYGIGHRHLIFTKESGADIIRVLRAYSAREALVGEDVRRTGRRESDAKRPKKPSSSKSKVPYGNNSIATKGTRADAYNKKKTSR